MIEQRLENMSCPLHALYYHQCQLPGAFEIGSCVCVMIWQYLCQCVVGATLQPTEEEEAEAAEDNDEEKEQEENKAITYEVIGTLSDPASQKPDFVKEIVKVHHNDA